MLMRLFGRSGLLAKKAISGYDVSLRYIPLERFSFFCIWFHLLLLEAGLNFYVMDFFSCCTRTLAELVTDVGFDCVCHTLLWGALNSPLTF